VRRPASLQHLCHGRPRRTRAGGERGEQTQDLGAAALHRLGAQIERERVVRRHRGQHQLEAFKRRQARSHAGQRAPLGRQRVDHVVGERRRQIAAPQQ